MSFDSEYLELRKKRKKQEEENTQKVVSGNPLNTVKTKTRVSGNRLQNASQLMDIAPVRIQSTVNALNSYPVKVTEQDEKDRTWFKKSKYFDNGYDVGDVTKTILGTAGDIGVNLIGSIGEMSEGLLNVGATAVGKVAGIFGNDELQKETEYFIEEDKVYGADDVNDFIEILTGYNTDEASVLGEKLDSTVQSGGQLLAASVLQLGLGVPWWVTMGTTSFGGKMSESLNEGATYDEALLSSTITTGAELLTEKLSGGIKFGGKALDDVLTQKLATSISNKFVRTATKFGMDITGEGTEEVLSQAIGNFGDWLTYRNDEELKEVLTSEEAMDEYIESFISGGLMGGIAGGVKAGVSAKNGVDYTSQLTADEEKVVNSIYENRIAESETDGKTLTQREKNKIYDDVLRDLDKGYISTDTIEEVLGGETYKSYKDTIDNETALQNEFNTLNKMKQSEMTGEQTDRRAELKQKLEELKNNSNKTQLKEQLSNDVFNLVKGSRLVESYNETARRGQTFEADLSKYDAKQQEVVKKAVESGILNNTNRTHEFVDMVAKISADKGVLFDFSNNEKIKESGFAVDGKTVNGYVDGNGNISLNIDSSKALNSVVGHEITHILEGTELHDALKDVVKQYATTKGEYDTRLQTLSKLYEGVDGANIENELTADLIGDYLFTDSEFINKLSTKNRNVFKKIYDEIKYLCKIATAGSKEARELEKVKRAFDKAYKESANTKAKSDTKYSLAMVEKVQPTSNKWHRTLTTEEAKARFPKLWDVTAEESEVRNPTQISSTVKSYRRIYDFLQSEGFDGTILDASSGLGYGTRAGIEEYGFNVEDIEPFPDKDYNPKYKDYSTLNKKYDVVISNAVLNVLPQDQRDALVIKMGELLNDGGRMFVSTRGRDVDSLASNKNNTNISPMEWFVDSTGSYQKGFTKPELVAYLQDALGDGFTVKPTNLVSGTAVIVTKDGGVKYSLSDSKGRNLTKEQAEYFKDSKVRDAEGNLIPVYHGTFEDFTVFDINKTANANIFGKGHYFTNSEKDARNNYATSEGADVKTKIESLAYSYFEEMGYTEEDLYDNDHIDEWNEAYDRAEAFYESGKVMQVYLNITNPVYADKYQSLYDKEGNFISARSIEGLKELGFDGIIDYNASEKFDFQHLEEETTHYVVFDSNQIKNIDNQNPTKDEDIRYSLSESDDYSRIQQMQLELNETRRKIAEIEKSEDFKSQMAKLTQAISNDDVDNGIKEYNRWQEVSGYGELISRKNSLETELERARKAYSEKLANAEVEKERIAIEKSGLSEADYFRKQAVKEFGYTPYFYDAGYITPNGKMLNFSGEKGRHFGSRGQDHRAIGIIFADTQGTDALNRFMKDGNIRILAESPAVDISTLAEPTKEQYSTIRKFIYEYAEKGYFAVDFSDENGIVVGSLGYENNINPARIINDIKHFYETGEIREQSNTDKFRYSLSEDSKDRVFYTPFGVEVVQNPTNAEYRQMREDIYNAYPHLRGTGEGILRHTYDEEGNVYYWNAYDGMHSSVEPYINKKYNTRTSQHWEWWKRDDKDDYPTDYSHIRYSLSKDSEGRELTKEQQNYFKNAKTVDENGRLKPFYHGAGRADRVGNVFDPARATSGPMAYFTDSKEIADNYARDKKDTSIAYDSDYDSYETQFRVTRNGKDMSVIDLWNTLSMSERNAITEKAKHITMDDDWENVVYSEDADYGLGNFDKYELNRHRGNALHTLVDSWLTDGNIFGEEHKFLDVLKLVGIEDARYMNPEFRDEKTYQVYLNITNPFDTSNISNEMLEALRVASENAEYVEGNMADLWDKRNIEPTRWFEGLKDDIENGTSYTWTRIPDFVTDTLKAHGYDGIFDKGGKNGGAEHTVAIPFYSEQVKNVDNLNPTTSNDIRYSLLDTDNLPKIKGSHLTYGEDIKLRTNEDIAPVAENAPVETTEQVAPVEDTISDDFAPISEEEANAIREEGFNALNDIDAPLETSTEPYYIADTTRLDDKTLKNISSVLKDALSLNKAETKAIQDIVQNYSTSETQNTDDLFNEIKDRFGEKAWTERNEEIAEVKQTLRNYKLRVSPTIKGEIADYSDFMRRNFGKLVISKNGMPVDTAYMELSATYPEFFPPDVTNATDQLLKMSEVANMDINESLTAVLDDETIQEATDIISDIVNTYKENAIRQGVEADNQSYLTQLDRYFELLGEGKSEAIKPRPEKLVGEEEQRAKNKMARADKVKGNAEQTAKIITDEPKVEKKKNRAWSKFVSNFVDKASPFETLALKTGNREVDAKFNAIRYAEGKAQNLIGKGAEGVKALNDIIAEVKADGLTDSLYEYLYHKHNVDRMTLEDRYKDVPNKAVFGDSVTAKVSQDIVEQYEFAEPKLVEYANEIYNYNRHLRKMLVDGGVISQETADLWEEMYPHYVPIRRVGDDGLNINVPLDTGRTGVNAPIKRATGGSRDILPLFDTMAQRTIQTYKAIAKNRFGVELKNTLGTTVENAKTNLDEVIDSIDTQESLLQEGKNGKNPTFTVFENGEKVTFEITEEMYDALKPTSEGLSYTNKALNTINNVRRGLLTEYNPTFMLTNAVKDAQDVLINSQHPARTYKNFPKAIKELATKGGKWYSEYMKNGGEQNTYFEKDTNAFKEEKTGFAKLIGMPLDKISDANNFIERIPRLAEYIASREMGRSIDVAMLDSARVTTNFSAGGDVTKFLNRNGATFLNASIQGAVQQVRNVREAKYNGLKGWVQLGAKTMLAGLPALLLNGLLWDDDEEYEELSDYVKENYYIVAKFGDGKFVRIPKGRAVAVIQNAFEQTWNALTGDDEVDLNRFLELAISNLAPNNPLDNNVIAPIMQVANNETWYGEDLVPTRLQDLPNAEQYDESTDAISKWLGEKLNYSPYKINYLLDQYSGGIGDMILPMLTPEAESGNNSFSGNLLAPIKDKFTTDSVMNNQVVSDFYKTSDELTTNAKSSKATDEDILKYKYINSVQTEMGELYAEKREIQNSNLSDEIKYKKVREIQEEINALSENALNTYGTVNIDGNYANVGDRHYRLNDENEWQKINDKQLEKQEEVTSGLGITPAEYWTNKAEYDYAYDSPEKYAVAKAVGGYSAYKTYSSELYDIHADKDSNGKSISGSRKEKVLDYINNLDIDYYEKLILFKSEYNADDTYNYEIIDYLNNRDDISYEEEVAILKELGFNVDSNGNISWD